MWCPGDKGESPVHCCPRFALCSPLRYLTVQCSKVQSRVPELWAEGVYPLSSGQTSTVTFKRVWLYIHIRTRSGLAVTVSDLFTDLCTLSFSLLPPLCYSIFGFCSNRRSVTKQHTTPQLNLPRQTTIHYPPIANSYLGTLP